MDETWNATVTHLKNRKWNVQSAHFDRNADHIIKLVNPRKTRTISRRRDLQEVTVHNKSSATQS